MSLPEPIAFDLGTGRFDDGAILVGRQGAAVRATAMLLDVAVGGLSGDVGATTRARHGNAAGGIEQATEPCQGHAGQSTPKEHS
jgi:hypothetical protein